MSEETKRPFNHADEWKRIFRDIERQVRREAARAVGTQEDAGWKEIGKESDEAARRNAAKAVGLAEDASWDEIGERIERRTRAGIAHVVGTSEESDWATIGQMVDEKVHKFLDQIFNKPAKTHDRGDQPTDDLVDPWS